MKLPSDETPDPNNEDGYLSDEFDQIEMIPPPIRDGDFSEYEWMEHEDEFNSQVLRELEEEELMEQCLVAMLDDEEAQGNGTGTASNANSANSANSARTTNENTNSSSSMNGLSDSVNNMSLSNGVRSSAPSDNSSNSSSNRPNRFSVQNRLNRTSANGNVSNAGEPKESTLNPDAKEFVPLGQNNETSTATSENPNVSS